MAYFSPQVYGYCPYGTAYAPGAQVVYAANGQAYAVPCQYHYAGESAALCSCLPGRGVGVSAGVVSGPRL